MSGTWVEKGALASKADVDAVASDAAGKAPAVHTHSAADVGLGNVDNTSDANKPVSTAQQTALDAKAPKASPTFAGTVTAPSVKLTTGAGAGRVLTSAADGTGSWTDPAPAGAPGVVVTGPAAGGGSLGPVVPPNATASNQVVIGTSASSSNNDRSVVIGSSSSNNGQGGVAVGHAAVTAGNGCVSIGREAGSGNGGSYGVAIGQGANASGDNATAIGFSATATHTQSVALGRGASTTASNQVMLGASNHTVVAPNKLQIGPIGALAATLSTRTNGSGKTELVVQFATGSPIVIATQP